MTEIKITPTQTKRIQKELDKHSRISENLTVGQIQSNINHKIQNVKKKNLKYIVIVNEYFIPNAYKYNKGFVQFKCYFTKSGSPVISIAKSFSSTRSYGGGMKIDTFANLKHMNKDLLFDWKVIQAIVNDIVNGGF